MQTGVKKREELHEKYQEKFKELGVSQFNVVDNLLKSSQGENMRICTRNLHCVVSDQSLSL